MNDKRHAIPGLDTFNGLCLHGHDWRGRHDLRGLRVGVVASGAGAVPIVPELVKLAARVKVFQNGPLWVLPQSDLLLNTAGRLWGSPPARLLAWRARTHLQRQVREPWLRRQLTPNVPFDGQGVSVSDAFYLALQAPHCKLLTWPIDRVAPGGIRTVEGVEHQLDCIVLADPGA